jgi:Endonuclease-reverse transcriptase
MIYHLQFFIIDAGKFAEDSDKMSNFFKNFQINILKRGRLHCSGMITGVRKELICRFKIVKEMNDVDHLEAVSVSIWKDKSYFPCIAVYNPPNNKPNYDIIPIEQGSIIFGDFNSPSTLWGYKETTRSGKILEDFLMTSTIERIESSIANDYTFMSYSGSKTCPDLVLAHTNIANNVSQYSCALPNGHDHKVIKIIVQTRSITNEKKYSLPSWNFKKANWKLYGDITDELIHHGILGMNVHEAEKNLSSSIFYAAKHSIPRGIVRDYKPYWNDELTRLTELRDRALKEVENGFTV